MPAALLLQTKNIFVKQRQEMPVKPLNMSESDQRL